MIRENQRVLVVGPRQRTVKNKRDVAIGTAPASAQLGRYGTVVGFDGPTALVKLDGEDTRPRAFALADLKGQ